MTSKTFSRLSQYGNTFQIKVLSSLLTNKNLLINVRDTIESDYFDDDAHKWIVETIVTYFDKYHTVPSIDTLHVEVKKIENEVIRISVKEQLKEAYKASDEDLKYVEEEFSNFCKNQQLKKALLESVNLLNLGAYDDIRKLIDQALRAGDDKNVGHIYDKDIESRYRHDDRGAIPFPWKTFNDMTQGGMGKGDLVLLFGNPKGGKSWAAVAIGAFALASGYDVAHYTLELSEGYVGKRYDAVFTGIPVDQLDGRKKDVEKWFENNPLGGRLIIKEYPPRRASMGTIRSHLDQLELQYNFVPKMIIIDYLDYLKTSTRKDRKEEIDDVYVAAKGLAKERQVPVISPSQANRTGADNDIIEGKNAAGSYDKIMIADILLSLSRNRRDKLEGTGKWHIMGNRYGSDGLTFASTIDTSTGKIEIEESPFDIDNEDNEDSKETKNMKKSFNDLKKGDIDHLRKQFFNMKKEEV